MKLTDLYETTYKIYIDGKLFASPKGDIKALRAQVGFITGFPSTSASTVNLVSSLLDVGSAMTSYKGKKVRVKLKITEVEINKEK